MNDNSIIKFDNVVKRFGNVTILDSLNFNVQKGEKVTIIGPSGSGKSTVLRILMTLETINDGVIHVGGKPLRSEEHTSELQSLMRISYAVFCLNKKKNTNTQHDYAK